LIGDVNKSVSIIQKQPKESLEREKKDPNKLAFEKYSSDLISAYIVGIESIRPQADLPNNHYTDLNEFEKRNFSFLIASREGYLRTYVSTGKNQLEIVSQLNIGDGIKQLKVIKPQKIDEDYLQKPRSFLCTTTTGAAAKVRLLNETQATAVENLVTIMSQNLPYKSGLTPLH